MTFDCFLRPGARAPQQSTLPATGVVWVPKKTRAGGAGNGCCFECATMFRKSSHLLRIGVHIDPSYAGFPNQVHTHTQHHHQHHTFRLSQKKAFNIVTGSGLEAEAGFASSNDTPTQQKAKARLAFESRVEQVRDTVGNTATLANAVRLLDHGHISEGTDMAAFLDRTAPGGLSPEDVASVLAALSVPALQRHFHEASDHDPSAALKEAGSIKGTQRVAEAEHLFGLLKTKVQWGRRTEALEATDPATDALVSKAYGSVLGVYASSGYDAALQVPDYLYDRMFFEKIRPTVRMYNTTLAALGVTTRMKECDALWSWLSTSSGLALPLSSYAVRMAALLEAERFVDVERLYGDVGLSAHLPDSQILDLLALGIYRHSRHSGGAIPAAEEKKLIFLPTHARKAGVPLTDLSLATQTRVAAALERWTYRRGLEKTVHEVFDKKAHEYQAWNEGQRYAHIAEDEVNTSMIESAVRLMRGDQVEERMRLDVQKGGGRGVIYPPKLHSDVTRYAPPPHETPTMFPHTHSLSLSLSQLRLAHRKRQADGSVGEHGCVGGAARKGSVCAGAQRRDPEAPVREARCFCGPEEWRTFVACLAKVGPAWVWGGCLPFRLCEEDRRTNTHALPKA